MKKKNFPVVPRIIFQYVAGLVLMAEMLKGEKFDSRSLWSFFFLFFRFSFRQIICVRVCVYFTMMYNLKNKTLDAGQLKIRVHHWNLYI